MKKILFTLLFLVAFFAGFTQMTNNGGIITVEGGATLVIEGDYTSSGTGAIEIDGDVILKGDFINNGGSVATGSTGDLVFNGASLQEITGSQTTTFYCAVEVDNAAGVALTATAAPGANQVLDSNLILTNGMVTLNGFDLTLSDEGITGPDATKFIETNSTGQLMAPVGNSDVVFPVGVGTAYNPVTLNEAGTADTYGVAYAAAAPAGWSPTEHAVDGSWTVTEGTPGGNDLTVTPQWNGTDELTDFDNTDCAVGVTTDNGATIAWKASGAASGTDPYFKSGAGFAGVGTFVVGDFFFEGIELDLDLFLAGPYSGGTMSTALNALIPTTDPYGNGISGATIPGTAVDWIEVELRDQTTPGTVIKSYSFFLDNGGNVLDVAGTLGAKLTGLDKDSYYVAINHRNHLGAMTASAIDFTAGGPFGFDFTAGTGIYGTNAMQSISGTYALWAGDANADGQVIYQGTANDPTPISNEVLGDAGNTGSLFTYIVNGYSDNDINLDGQVIYQGTANDPTPISNAVLGHPLNTGSLFTYIVTEQLP